MRTRATPISVGILLFAVACQNTVETPTKTAVALHVAPSGLDGPFAVAVGQDVTLSAVPVAADSTKLGDPVTAAWTSNDTLIATVNSAGRVHTRCVGIAVVSAVANANGRTLRGSATFTIGTVGPTCV